MGLMRFVADDRGLLTEERLARAYVAGPDEAPTFTRVLLSGDSLVAERVEDTSGSFTIPWPIAGHGDWMLSTASLMERERPYQLEVELARGLVFRVRDQLAVWETLGLKVSDPARQAVALATRSFSRAAVSQTVDPAEGAAHARDALLAAADAALLLTDLYAEQALALRMPEGQRLSTLFGARISAKAIKGSVSKRLAETFNLVGVPCGWGAVEPSEGHHDWSLADKAIAWARQSGLRAGVGPLLEFDEKLVPDWAYLWEGDAETLTSLMLAHVRTTVQRYRGKVQLWHVASKINRNKVLGLTDEQRLQIVAGAVRTARQLDPSTPVVVGVDQPWGEYRGNLRTDLSPLDFADALDRANLGIAGFDLEVNIGYHPLGTELRNPLAFSRLIDLWNIRLESPLMLTITFPATSEEDPASDSRMRVVAAGESPELLTPDFQAEWARRRLPMLLAKNAVQIVMFGQAIDRGPHSYPNAGLFDHEKGERPIVGMLKDLRERYLG